MSVKKVTKKLYSLFNKEKNITMTHTYRQGNIRHCIADTQKIKRELGWKPKVRLEIGLQKLVHWSFHEKAEDTFDKAHEELRA